MWAFGWHTGIDIVSDNKKVYGTCEGIVYRKGYDKSYGNYIVIRSKESDTYHWFCHLEKIKIIQGQHVSRGTVLGIMGNTGNSSGTHLHFEIRDYTNKYGETISPAKYMGVPNEIGHYNSRDFQIVNDSFKIGAKVYIPCKFTGAIEGKYSLVELNNTQMWVYSYTLSANRDSIKATICYVEDNKIMVEIESLLVSQKQFWVEKSEVIL